MQIKKVLICAGAAAFVLSGCTNSENMNTAAKSEQAVESTSESITETAENEIENKLPDPEDLYPNNNKGDNNASETENSGESSDVSAYYGYDLPLMFSCDYTENPDGSWKFDIEDKGDCFIVKGKLICPSCIDSETAHGTEIGEKLRLGNGVTYTVTQRTTYNNDQREKVLLSGSDGKEYEIVNIPAFQNEKYTQTCYYKVLFAEGDREFVTEINDVKLKINADTTFFDGKNKGETFGEYYRSGVFDRFPFSSCYSSYTFDIHFAENGDIDIFTGSEPTEWYDKADVERISVSFDEIK